MIPSIMRRAVVLLFAAALLALPVRANDTKKNSSSVTLERLQGELQRQQERIQQLEALLKEQVMLLEALQRQWAAHQDASKSAAVAAPAAADDARSSRLKSLAGHLEAVAAGQIQLGEPVNRVLSDLANTPQAVEAERKRFGPFTFSGDARLRLEPFFGGPSDKSLQRARGRIRLRFNANAKFSDEFSGGLSLATGDLNDPISTNQTLTEFYTRKPIAVDKAFIAYHPNWFKPLTLTGGKFGYTWYRTELTWDDDLNPEGVSESLAFDFKNSVFQKLVLVGFQLPFNELAGKGLTNDSLVYGGQVQTYWKLGRRTKFAGDVAFYNFHRADPIANALSSPSVLDLLKLGGASVQNSMTTTAPFRFASKFALLDVIGRLDINTGHGRWPLVLLFDFVQNTRACANRNALATGAKLGLPCNPRDRQGYWAEARVGRTQEKGDFNFAYTFLRIEREAVLGAFNFSDLRQNSNVAQHRVELSYQAYKNIRLGFTGLIGRPLASNENYLKRLQLDLLYNF